MNKKADVEHSRKLDQFYTNPFFAEQFLVKIEEHLDLDQADILLEPSAGFGSFYSFLDPARRIGLDLDPQYPGIIQMNFFDWIPPKNKTIITVGNPPFGKNASDAVKFFNGCAKFSLGIGFIVPRTFRKASIQNRLNPKFHLVYDQDVPKNSFLFKGKEYDVPCAAQIWIAKDSARPRRDTIKLEQITHWFEIVSPSASDFAIQRVGGRAGQIRIANRTDFSVQSHYFIKAVNSHTLDIFKQVDFDQVKYNTAGNPSVSPSELIELFISTGLELGYSIVPLPKTN